MVDSDHSAIQISLTVFSTLLLLERLILFGYIFAQKNCSDYLLLGVTVSYLMQLLFTKMLKVSVVSKSKNPIPFMLAFVFTLAGGAAMIAPPAAALTQSDFETNDIYDHKYCDLVIRLAVGIPQIIAGIPILTLGCVCADACRQRKRNPDATTEKQFNMIFLRLLFQGVNEICFFMLIMAFVNSIYWGAALLVSMSLSIIVWLFFTSTAFRNKETFMDFRAGRALNFQNPDCCTLLMLLPLLLVGPLYFFVVGSLALFELWQLQDDSPQQYYFVNINFILKLLFLLPTGFLFLAFSLVEEREIYFFYAFIAFWVFAFGNIGLPMVYTARKHGCKRKLLLATPSNTLFTKQEVTNFYQNEIQKIVPKNKEEK